METGGRGHNPESFGSSTVRCQLRQRDALLVQVIFDRERHTAFEAGRREDVARMTAICQPFHDRPQALCDASGWVADAVVIDQEEPHN